MAKDMSNDVAQSILKLHSHRDLADDGAPRMTGAMEAYLCQPHERVTRPGDLPAPLALPAAWARLQAQEPRLARTVAATVMRGLMDWAT